MKIKRFVIKYRYDDGREFLGSSLYDSFVDALSQLVYNKEHDSGVLVQCAGVLIMPIEFEI